MRSPDTLDSGRVRLIRPDAIHYRDAGGIGVGNTRREVAQAYPLEFYATFTHAGHTYRIFAGGNGISFEFGTDDRYRAVVILPAGRLPGETYLTLYGNIEVAGATE